MFDASGRRVKVGNYLRVRVTDCTPATLLGVPGFKGKRYVIFGHEDSTNWIWKRSCWMPVYDMNFEGR